MSRAASLHTGCGKPQLKEQVRVTSADDLATASEVSHLSLLIRSFSTSPISTHVMPRLDQLAGQLHKVLIGQHFSTITAR
jgi:hypothetical protein